MTHFDCMLACLWQFQATKDLFVGYQKSLGGGSEEAALNPCKKAPIYSQGSSNSKQI